MRILICNPDKKIAKQIERQVKNYGKKHFADIETYVFDNAVDVAAGNAKYDVAIIEASMDDISGITLGRVLSKATPYTKLIFTSYEEESLDASFDVNAVRFFIRPYSLARFYEGLTEAIRRLDNENMFFELNEGAEKVRVNKNDIYFIEIENRRTKVVTKAGSFCSSNNMSFWREHLHGIKYISPHKSYIVNMDYIFKYKRNDYLVMANGERISVARGKGADIHNKYTDYKNLYL